MINWPSKIPPYETQFCAGTGTDVECCVSESFCHIIEMLLNNQMRFSPRALAYLSRTTPQGNSETNVLAAANKYGLIPYALWPTPDSFTWDSYYTPIPDDILAQAIKVDVKIMPGDINKSPLWTILRYSATTSHAVAQITATTFFDSEVGSPVKTINYPIDSQVSLKLNSMTNAKLANNKGEWGFYIPATNEAALIDKALNLGYIIPTLNNGANVDWTNLKADITIP